jgi:hypothetical protein
VFIIGLTAATFSSADSVLTTLTTSFYLDFLNVEKSNRSEEEKTKIREENREQIYDLYYKALKLEPLPSKPELTFT